MSDPEAGAEAEETDGDVKTELSRDMGLTDITMIGIGAMIGAGVFALTSFAAGIAGPALMLAFLFNGILGLLTAMSYAELGAAFPEAGGGYLWVKESLVDPNGFYAGWMSWFAHAVACSLYAVTFGTFLTEFIVVFSGLSPDFVLFGFLTRIAVEKVLAALVVVAFVYINYRGAEETGKSETFVVVLKLIILGLFIVFGLLATFANPNWPAIFLSRPSFAPTGVAGILGAMGFTYIGFEGYEVVVQSGEEVVDPGKNMPKAVILSMFVVIPIYILIAFTAIGGIDVTQQLLGLAGLSGQANVQTWEVLGGLGELGLIRAAGQFMPYGVPLLIIAGLAATMSAINATVYSSSRVSFAMGRDRTLPSFFEKIHPTQRTPYIALFLSMIVIVIMAVTLPIESVAAGSDIMFLLLFIQVDWAVVRMRATHPDLPRTFKVPYMPWPPLIAIAGQVLLLPFLIYTLGLEAIGIGTSNDGLVALGVAAIWMGLGLVVYYGYSTKQEAEQIEEETPTLMTARTSANRESEIVVPIANPESAEPLMRTALDIARDRNAEIHVISVVTVPQQTPIDEGERFIENEREVLNHAISFAEDTDVPVNGTIRVGHDIAQAILNTVEQYDSDLLLMGWRGRQRRRRDFVLGSNVDQVVTQAQCDVLVERIGPTRDVSSILLPTAGGPHSEFAAETAQAIARTSNARIDLVRVLGSDASDEDRADAEDRLDSTAGTLDEEISVEYRILHGDDIVDAIVEESAEYDLTIIGATREGLLEQFVFGVIPEEVGRRAENTVIMAKRNLGITSSIRRLFSRNQQ